MDKTPRQHISQSKINKLINAIQAGTPPREIAAELNIPVKKVHNWKFRMSKKPGKHKARKKRKYTRRAKLRKDTSVTLLAVVERSVHQALHDDPEFLNSIVALLLQRK